MSITGNKGEWSEIYVFLKLLAEGRLNAADENLDAIPNVYYPIIQILRNETSKFRQYVLNGDIEVIDGETGNKLFVIAVEEFVKQSKKLLEDLKNSIGRSFSIPTIEEFLKSIEVNSLTALSTDKSDIKLVVHDLNTGMQPTLGFSIKSMLGKDATLFNPGAGTNFIYKLTKPKNFAFDVNQFNATTLSKSLETSKSSKIGIRINELEELGFKINFHKIQSSNLELNLKLIDSQLPEILSFIVFHKYKTSTSKLTDLLTALNQNNPLGFDTSKGHPFYEVKLKNFLTESALGMTPETVWSGVYDATGGIIIVKETGDLVCYHIYNRNEFQNYLMNNTKIEQASTSEDENNPGFAKLLKPKPYKFGWVYEEAGEYFIKLNLQIRFK
jgi:HpaII restriction endonuclease